jgi:hypothetical protein
MKTWKGNLTRRNIGRSMSPQMANSSDVASTTAKLKMASFNLCATIKRKARRLARLFGSQFWTPRRGVLGGREREFCGSPSLSG